MTRNIDRVMPVLGVLTCFIAAVTAQPTPGEYQEVLRLLGKQGDYKGNVLKVNIPRSDLKVWRKR